MASKDFPVAIIGMAVRLPGAESCEDFWKLLIDGQSDAVNCLFPESRASDVDHTLSAFQSFLLNEKEPFLTGSFFKSVDKFDADLFSINPKEAPFIEPEQRFFLELVWELLEDAGYACKIKGSKTGVYVGNSLNKYKYILTENYPRIFNSNLSSCISSRVSYTFDLSGPAMMVASGSSSSLLAVHLACQGLLSKDCEMAIAGGITLDLLPLSLRMDIWNQLGIIGPTIECRAFDTGANRIAKGEGCGVVLLKPLNKAISDGDFVYAVLDASCTIKQDEHSNRISTAHPVAQANLLTQAWSVANISPNSIGYFEVHRTAAELGDPIEISSITTAFKNLGIKSHHKIPVSSVKANIGHLADGGAGILALIKVVLCLIKGQIPPSINHYKPNSSIEWDTAPVYVNTTLLDWKQNDKNLRYASISSFDLLRTNVHAVIREFSDVLSSPKSYLPSAITNDIQILAMAANSQQSLYHFACKIRCYLNTLSDESVCHLRNVCYTVNTSREQIQFSYKAIVYATDFDKMMSALEKLLDIDFNMEDLAKTDISNYDGNSGFAAFYKYSTINFKNNYPNEKNFIKSFLEGKAVNWSQFYHNCDVRRVSLVPTYAFDRKRFWPDIKNKPINVELLHQVRSSDKESSNLEDRLAETLNDALGVNYNWEERGDDNLFALGMDSLIFTRICMKLQSEPSNHDNLLLSKFHQNPTFNSLKNLVKDSYCKANIHTPKSANVSDLIVGHVFNEIVAIPDTIQNELDQATNYNDLSAAQHRMLVMQEIAPESTAYVETIAYYTTNEINATDLFENLLQYHPILASRIVQNSKSKNLAVYIKHENVNCDVKLELINSFEDAGAYLTESIPAMKVLSSPLAIFRLLKAEDKLIFVVHMHRIITDDITLSNVAHDLCSLMNNSAKEHLLCNHSAISENESIYLKSSQMDLDKNFWNQVFLTLPPETNLAILPKGECIWSNTVVSKAKHISKLIPVHIVKEILRFCNSIELTEFHVYLACVALVLQRYLGVNELALAIPVTARTELYQTDDGLFDNTVLFRLLIDGDCSVKTYIKAVAKSWLQVLAHSHYPFDKVANLIWEKHEKSVSSFSCILFNYIIQKRPSERELHVMSKHAKMPFSINVVHNNDDNATKVLCEWASEMIDDGIAWRIVDGIVEIFEKVLSNLSNKISDVQVLSFSECSLLKLFSQPYQEYKVLNINKTFKNHATNHPDAIAIIFKDKMTTYFQLEKMALLIAFELYRHVDQSVLRRKPIILITEKSEHAIASFLGVWKAGGHFLPISFNTINSLKGILESVTPAVILVSDSFYNNASILGEQYKIPCIKINTLLTNPISSHIEFYDPVINEDDLAYIIRTSGSTGMPKTCKVSHKSLGVIANAWKLKYEMTTFQVNVLQWAQISFDVFIGDLIRGLVCSAGTLIICPDEHRLDIPYIIKLIKQHKVTIAETTPQFALQLIQNSKHHDLDSLNILILGSDILQSYVYKKVKEQLNPNQRLLNSYGMTEATIDSSFFEGGVVPKTRSKAIPIGKPLPGVILNVLDPKSLQPCPVGTIGELYIGGPVLASGDTEILHIQCINCDCLKTNDAAAWLPSGDIELFGRLDRVTKLRGFRISTTEIENKIVTNVIGVEDACVVVLGSKNDNSENKFLCAFIVLKPNEVINLAVLRNQLNGILPYYMLPDIVHTMEMIPLSQNGKVDYKALPSLSDLLGNIKDEQEIRVCTDTESQVCITLRELLAEALGTKINQVQLDKTFMEQGAHSLILLYFATLVKEKTIYDIGITDIFSYPTINSLAAYIQKPNSDTDKLEKQAKFDHNDDIAITGIGLRLPGDIMTLPQLWQALNEGEDIIKDFPEERIKDFLNFLPSSSLTMYANMDTYQGAFLEEVDHFDCQFFEITPNEANYMSPQQRLFLQVATEALAEGRNLSEVKGTKIGVFVGQCDIHYAELNHPDDPVYAAGMMPGMVATRVAYQWDLKGPSVLVDTACSSSLMALKQACESIRNGECEGALVGGINVVLYPARKGELGKTGILSPEFHCKPFDKDASGTAVGEGVLCIYAQPLNSALKEKKHIYGVVKSIVSNSVGHGNGITAPSSISQQNLIKEALNAAHFKPSDISFVECHGAGTILGDRIELSALNSVFNHNLSIGSTKGMFGHLNSAAGLLGVFKILASLMARQIPPTLHFKNPHPEIQNSPIRVPSATINWNTDDGGRRLAGVTSLGLMGTNVHAIISEQTTSIGAANEKNSMDSMHYPLLFSGKNLKQLKKQVSLHETHIQQLILKSGSQHSLLRLCITVAKRLKDLQSIGVGHNEYRMVITAQNATQMIMVMKIIKDTENIKSFIQLVTLCSDVHFCSPEYKYTGTSEMYGCFLISGKVDLKLLFPSVADCDSNIASCVTMAYYNESRHWLEHSFNQNIKESETDYEDLLSLMKKKATETRELIRMLPLSPTQDLRKTQRRFCSAIIVKLFFSTHLSVFLENGKQITLKEAFNCTGFLQKYDKLFFIMIRELFEADLVQAVGQNESIRNLNKFYFKCKDYFNVDPESIANYAVDKYPLWADCFRLPLYCSKSLHDVLIGKISSLSVIYPQDNFNYMRQFDKLGDPLGDVYYNMYMQVIAMHTKKLSTKHTKVRILEVGAGMGNVTRQLLPKLKDIPNIEYWFTDLGKAFVDQAKATFADYSNIMKFSTFDITKNPIMQGVLGSFDVIISYNVIHTTESIFASVINLNCCLGENGVLFIIESTMNNTWAALTWGILDSWWYFKDYDLRPAEPMLEPHQWETILNKVGFASVYSFPTNIKEREHVEKLLFICSAKKIHETTSTDLLEWWEYSMQKTVKHDEINNKDQVNINADKNVEILINESMVYKALKNIWSDLLGVKDIEPDDNFYFLGGESHLAAQMISLVCRRIGYQLEIADTFTYPTLRALTSFVYERLLEKNGIAKESAENCTENKSNLDDINIPVANEIKTHGVLLMFPGIGAQKVGMCKSMIDCAPAKEIFKRAKQILGYNILDICTNNESLLIEKLKSTEFIQVALFTGCVAKVEQLKYEQPELLRKVTHVAGLSVGEFVALVYAGVLKFEDALKFIQKRGEAMENDVKENSTGMISVFGPNSMQLQEFLENHYPTMTISSYLGNNQHTVAGTGEECQALMRTITETNVYSSKLEIVDIRKLKVAGAFHSSHMEQAANPLLNETPFSKPLIPVIMSVTGQIVEDPLEIKLMSRKHMVAGIKWKQTITTAYNCGVRNFIEVAPSCVLSPIVKKTISECQDCNVMYINV